MTSMKVLLRNTASGCYYQDEGQWAVNPENGFDFGSIQEALEFARRISGMNLELALSFGNPSMISAVSIKAAQDQVAQSRAAF
jgi:hypothetical protein